MVRKNKRGKDEAVADKDSAVIGAELVALKRRNPEAASGEMESHAIDVNIPDDSIPTKGKVHGNVSRQKLKKETADIETADQGVDVDMVRKNKRGKDEAVADKDSAVIGAELVALKRRNPEAASGEGKSHAIDVNIPDDSIPTKGRVHENVSRQKLKKETADIETADQGVDVDMVRKNKRGKDEAVADKDSAVIGAELVALKRRNPEAASGEGKSHAIDVNIPDDSIPTKGKVHGNVSRRKLKKETADIETADQGVDVDMVRKNKRGKDEAVADKESAVIGAELVALKRRNPEAASGEGKSHAIDVNIPDDSIPTKGKVHGNVSRRKLKKETADIETADQGADIDMVRMNKREKDEAVAGKESAAVGAELFVLKRRNTGTAASEMRSQAVEVNLPDDFVHRDGSHAGKGHLPVTQFDAEESGLNTPKSAGEDAPLSENKSSRRRKHSTKRRRQRTSAGVEHVAANVDLVALVKRSPGTSGASGAQAVGVNLPDNTEHFENMKKKETKKGRKKKSTKKDTGKKNPKLDPEKQAPETAKAISDSEKTEPPKRGRRSLITPRHSKEDLPKEGDAHEPSQIPPKSSKKKKKKTKKAAGIENKEEAQNEKQRSGDLTAEEVSLDKSKKTKKPKKKTKKGTENKEEPQNEKQKSGDLTAEEVSLDKSKKTKKPKKKTKKGIENKEEPQNEKQKSGDLTAEEVSLDKSKKTKKPKKKTKKGTENKEEPQNEKQKSGDLTAEEVSLDKSKKTKKPKKKTKKGEESMNGSLPMTMTSAAGIENKEEPQNEKQKSGDLTAEEVSLDKSKKTKKPKKKTKKGEESMNGSLPMTMTSAAGIENKEEPQNEKQKSGDLTAEEVSLDKSKKTKKPKKKTKKGEESMNGSLPMTMTSAAGIENKEEPQNEKQKSGDLTAEEVSLDKSKKTKKPKRKTKKGTENKEEPQNEKQRSGGLTAEEVSLDKSKKTKQPKKKSKKNKSNEKPSQILPDELQPNVIPKAIGEEANAEKSPDAEEKHVAAADDKASKPAVRAKTKRKKKTESKRKGGMNKQVKQENVPVAEETSKQKMDEVEINKKDGNPKKKKKKQKDK
uniref:Uncharacterized protein n=1 Tax=Trichuris muris TaxID=70415 RepID=A0A5S6Q3L7_TRIMR